MKNIYLSSASCAVALLMSSLSWAVGDEDILNRKLLPIHEPERPTYDVLDARDAKAPPRFEVKAPAKAPNVVIVLLDDVGFGAPSTFGGPVQTPTLDSLAAAGLSFNNFHTTALCSPTRTALKSGRNHHTANAGSIAETATAFPGNTGQIPNSVAPLAEMLRLNGYSTAHLVSGMKLPAGKQVFPDPLTVGPPTRASINFTASSVGKPTNGAPLFMMASPG